MEKREAEKTREPRVDEWRLAYGPWPRFWANVGDWVSSSGVAYYGGGIRWWHRGQTLTERAWLAFVPVRVLADLVYGLAVRFGQPE